MSTVAHQVHPRGWIPEPKFSQHPITTTALCDILYTRLRNILTYLLTYHAKTVASRASKFGRHDDKCQGLTPPLHGRLASKLEYFVKPAICMHFHSVRPTWQQILPWSARGEVRQMTAHPWQPQECS